MTNALFYEYQITANDREQAFVETLLGEICGPYDASGDGLDNSELISCLQDHGQEIWTGAATWAESRAGAYDPDVWYEALDGADTDNDGQLTGEEGVAALEAYLGFTMRDSDKLQLMDDLDTLCGEYDGDDVDGLLYDEVVECLTDHGQWIWEELSFYKAATTTSS